MGERNADEIYGVEDFSLCIEGYSFEILYSVKLNQILEMKNNSEKKTKLRPYCERELSSILR